MTPLRQRMLEDMQLRGFSARTQECYASAVRQLAEHYRRSPDQLTRRICASIYACGLRLLEGARLQVADVDSARMVVHVHGKGKQDRFRCPRRSCRGCVRIGGRIARASGCFRHQPAAAWRTVSPTTAGPSPAVVCRVRSARVLDYLARYLFRIAITNSRLEQIDDEQVTFRYRDNRTQAIRRATLSGVVCVRQDSVASEGDSGDYDRRR
jgi:hypothetical protein